MSVSGAAVWFLWVSVMSLCRLRRRTASIAKLAAGAAPSVGNQSDAWNLLRKVLQSISGSRAIVTSSDAGQCSTSYLRLKHSLKTNEKCSQVTHGAGFKPQARSPQQLLQGCGNVPRWKTGKRSEWRAATGRSTVAGENVSKAYHHGINARCST
jgi:hypothetical protein